MNPRDKKQLEDLKAMRQASKYPAIQLVRRKDMRKKWWSFYAITGIIGVVVVMVILIAVSC